MESATMVRESQSTSLPSAWTDRIFARLSLAYGNKFTDMWKGQDPDAVKAMWGADLCALTADEIRNGLGLLRKEHPSWPPTLYEFLDLCKPSAQEIDREAAFYEAVRGIEARRNGQAGTWSHRATYWAMVDVSAFDVAGSTWPQIRHRWTRALDTRLADPNLPAIPNVPKALPAPEIVRDGADARLDSMREQVGGQAKRNPRAWVQKILDRHAAGDKMLSDIAYCMALNSVNIR